MMLSELVQQPINQDVNVLGITDDSRVVGEGDVFFAYQGFSVDGRRFAADAVERGAVGVVCEPPAPDGLGTVVVEIENLREQLGILAARFHGSPSDAISTIAVTGTNGKTSFTQFLALALAEIGVKCGVIGTMGYGLPGQLKNPGLTTPSAIELQAMLRELVDVGCEAVALEASSHGLDQGRLNGTSVDVSVLTNLTHDHLDYHGTFEAYRDAKTRLFELPMITGSVVNLDDEFGQSLASRLAPVTAYSLDASAAAIRCEQIVYTNEGVDLSLSVQGEAIAASVPVYGEYNVHNILAVVATLSRLGYSGAQIQSGISALRAVTGRMERLSTGRPAPVFIDYAHTPDGLEKCLAAVRQHFAGTKITVVFGCGGDRDVTKRPQMGAIAARLADDVIVTSDNPRSEDPQQIIDAIVAGVGGVEGAAVNISTEIDRERAITQALSGDDDNVVVIAGKGHEDYQVIGNERITFSDHEVALRAVQRVAGR